MLISMTDSWADYCDLFSFMPLIFMSQLTRFSQIIKMHMSIIHVHDTDTEG